jgi:hypothetical protein
LAVPALERRGHQRLVLLVLNLEEDLLPHARAEKEKGHVRLEGPKEVKNL